MKMFEAIEVARKTGKKIRRGKDHAVWFDDKLIWEGIRTYVMISNVNLDADWEVVEPPPKEYDFAEAYRMMKAGKWMKCLSTPDVFMSYHGGWEWRRNDRSSVGFVSFSPEMIESKWIEVQP